MSEGACTIRLGPKIEAMAETEAENEHRSRTGFLKLLGVNHCRTLGLSLEHFAKVSRQ